jgi:hypothetical protein
VTGQPDGGRILDWKLYRSCCVSLSLAVLNFYRLNGVIAIVALVANLSLVFVGIRSLRQLVRTLHSLLLQSTSQPTPVNNQCGPCDK